MNRGRKVSGGKYHKQRKSKLYEASGQERSAVLGAVKRRQFGTRGGAVKTVLLKADIANIIVSGRAKKAQIINVESTPQNPFLARQNRLIKGAIIATSLGKARITNRPSQEGQVNAVLIGEK